MQASDFTEGFPGELAPIGGALIAFVPHALPEVLPIPPGLQIEASLAEKAIGRLSGMMIGGGNPLSHHLVGRPLQQREAIESSRIEGTFTTPEELAILESEDEEGDLEIENRADTGEVRNYIVALDWAMKQLDEFPISGRLIRGIHKRLLKDVRGGEQQPGEFRNIQNFIGATQDPHQARFVPPPEDRLDRLIHDLEKYIHIPRENHALVRLVRLALIHYQFETIHPFRDGNGRVGRILIPLLLKDDDPTDPPLYLSAFFEKNRKKYYDLLLAVSQRGAFNEWIEFFLEGVLESANSSLDLAKTLLDLRSKYHALCHDKKWPAACLQLIDHLFVSPVLTSKRVETLTGVSTPTASTYLKKLEEAGIISEFTKRARNRRYLAGELLRTVHSSPHS